MASEGQSAGIGEINIDIDQVTQVVQQNSATAEESAAASEEMSGQSALLQELVSQFKHKDNDNRTGVPAAADPESKRLSAFETVDFTNPDGTDYDKYLD